MHNLYTKWEFFNKRVKSDRALTIAVNIKMGVLNQMKLKSNSSVLNSTINLIQRVCIAIDSPYSNMNSIAIDSPYSNMNSAALRKPSTCHLCGFVAKTCPTRGKYCRCCSIANNFAKICRKPNDSSTQHTKPKSRVNNVET